MYGSSTKSRHHGSMIVFFRDKDLIFCKQTNKAANAVGIKAFLKDIFHGIGIIFHLQLSCLLILRKHKL